MTDAYIQTIGNLISEIESFVLKAVPELNRMRYDVTWKPDGSPVTAADKWLEDEISRILTKKLPGLTFIGEETWQPDAMSVNDWVAVLDPIDGTENFCSGLKEWGTSLSIWHKGQHAGSLLLMPELGESMSSGNIPRVPHSRIVGFSSSHNAEISKGLQENPEGRIMGCAVYNLFNVIRGSFARFINPKGAYSWDLLAGVALAYEAGCIVKIEGSDYDGRFLEPNRRYRVDIQHRYDLHSG
ncbi:inositol monophosphatase family protein [Asticcacaulis tiandongensis]|uniref:inositol monophosphatase family protein n=1 Tax=Asticcacaulis tiandongensis TaxID=2565365 RepID=UPI0011292A73|nr:inositol monophosphatase family protein [Asticcacaulis tiandongensis]